MQHITRPGSDPLMIPRRLPPRVPKIRAHRRQRQALENLSGIVRPDPANIHGVPDIPARPIMVPKLTRPKKIRQPKIQPNPANLLPKEVDPLKVFLQSSVFKSAKDVAQYRQERAAEEAYRQHRQQYSRDRYERVALNSPKLVSQGVELDTIIDPFMWFELYQDKIKGEALLAYLGQYRNDRGQIRVRNKLNPERHTWIGVPRLIREMAGAAAEGYAIALVLNEGQPALVPYVDAIEDARMLLRSDKRPDEDDMRDEIATYDGDERLEGVGWRKSSRGRKR